MKTFESEHRKALEWLIEEMDNVSHLSYETKGYDGSERTLAEQAIFEKYRSRVDELKKKYGVTQNV